MKMNCLHKTRTSFFNCHFFGDFKYDYDNNYANNITIMIMILFLSVIMIFQHSIYKLCYCIAKGADY